MIKAKMRKAVATYQSFNRQQHLSNNVSTRPFDEETGIVHTAKSILMKTPVNCDANDSQAAEKSETSQTSKNNINQESF